MTGPDIILVSGLPATGKSHFAHIAGRELGIPVLEKDGFKEVLFDDLGFRCREEKVRLGVAAMDEMYYTAAVLLEAGCPVILDNNFENSSIPGLAALKERFGSRVINIRFTGDLDTVYGRFVLRDQDPTRHRGHIVNDCYPEPDGPRAYVPTGREAFERKFRERGVIDFSFGDALITVDATDLAAVRPGEILELLKEERRKPWPEE